jgi:site-specific recombinase XerD
MELGDISVVYHNSFINERSVLSYYLRNWAMCKLIYYSTLLIKEAAGLRHGNIQVNIQNTLLVRGAY